MVKQENGSNMEEHPCNKEYEIDNLTKKVDEIYETINCNGKGDGMKVQLASVSLNLEHLMETICPMVEDMADVKEFMTAYKARNEALRDEFEKKNKSFSNLIAVIAMAISLGTLIVAIVAILTGQPM